MLLAPLDIEWVWYVHMLNPAAYAHDSIAQTGKVIDHRVVSYSERGKQLDLTKDLWNKSYPGEVFNVDLADCYPQVDNAFQSTLSYNLLEAAQKEMIFNYQVSLPHYGDDRFVKEAVKRYSFLLNLRREMPGTPFIPYFDNDLIWHAHMAHPKIYKRETKLLFDSLLGHQVSDSIRLLGSELLTRVPEARKTWENKGRSIAVSGSMFRGQPSVPAPDRNPDRYTSYSHKAYYLQPKELRIQDLPQGTYRVVVKCEAKSPEISSTFVIYDHGLDATNETWIKNFDFENDEGRFVLNTDKFYGLSVSLYKEITSSLYESHVCTSDFPPSSHKGNKVDEFVLPLRLKFTGFIGENQKSSPQPNHKYPQFNGVFHLLCRIAQPGIYMLRVEKKTGAFFPYENLVNLLQYPNIVIPYHLDKMQLECHYADYHVLGSLGDPAFHLRIIHCIKPGLSVIEVADFNSELVASAHVVDNGTLPHPSQVLSNQSCCSLNASTQRAMVIRSENCDWAILRAMWQGHQKFIDPGYLSAELFVLNTENPQWVAIHSSGPSKSIFNIDLTHIAIGKVQVDIERALVTFPGTVSCVPELLCLSACISVLFVLIQTRQAPPRDEQGSIIPYSSRPRKSYKLHVDDFAFVINAGLYCPSLPRTYDH